MHEAMNVCFSPLEKSQVRARYGISKRPMRVRSNKSARESLKTQVMAVAAALRRTFTLNLLRQGERPSAPEDARSAAAECA